MVRLARTGSIGDNGSIGSSGGNGSIDSIGSIGSTGSIASIASMGSIGNGSSRVYYLSEFRNIYCFSVVLQIILTIHISTNSSSEEGDRVDELCHRLRVNYFLVLT